jgi:CHASE2 domain-containing sensor protein
LRAASIEPKPIDDVTARMADAQGRFDIIRRRLRRFFRRDRRRLLLCVGRLKRANIRFWVTAAAILIAVEWATPYIEASLHLTNVKNWLFRTLAESVTNPPRFRDVRLVMIGDDEFWDGDLHHRSPTDRSYLARLVRALDIADASVIALDFDMRLPHPEVAVSPGDYPAVDAFQPYRDETNELIRAVDDVAQRRSIVLSKRIDGPIEGPFEMRSDIYQPYGICTRLTANGEWHNPGTPAFPLVGDAPRNIACGYIILMADKRRVPPPEKIAGQNGLLDSFPLAIVRAWDGAQARTADLSRRSYFTTYVPTELMDTASIVVSAHDLLRDPVAERRQLRGKAVIVGSAWHQRAADSHEPVDMHDTPVGPISGALLHGNLAEAILSDRVFPSLSERALTALEVLIGVAAAVFFAIFKTLWQKIGAVLGAMLLLLVSQWVTLQLFGTFFDAFVLVFALGLHAIIDRLIGEPQDTTAE